jgi:hypothetical protein
VTLLCAHCGGPVKAHMFRTHVILDEGASVQVSRAGDLRCDFADVHICASCSHDLAEWLTAAEKRMDP